MIKPLANSTDFPSLTAPLLLLFLLLFLLLLLLLSLSLTNLTFWLATEFVELLRATV